MLPYIHGSVRSMEVLYVARISRARGEVHVLNIVLKKERNINETGEAIYSSVVDAIRNMTSTQKNGNGRHQESKLEFPRQHTGNSV